MDIYYSSIGRNATLLLNFPIVHKRSDHMKMTKKHRKILPKLLKKHLLLIWLKKRKSDASNVRGNSKEFGAEKTIDGNKDTYWATDDGVTTASLTIDFRQTNHFQSLSGSGIYSFGTTCKGLHG